MVVFRLVVLNLRGMTTCRAWFLAKLAGALTLELFREAGTFHAVFLLAVMVLSGQWGCGRSAFLLSGNGGEMSGSGGGTQINNSLQHRRGK